MPQYILFDTPLLRQKLKPLVLARPIASLVVGLGSIANKWEHVLNQKIGFLTEDYLSKKFINNPSLDNIYINGSIVPNELFIAKVNDLKMGESLFNDSTLLATRTSLTLKYKFDTSIFEKNASNYQSNLIAIRKLSDLIVYNAKLLTTDLQAFIINNTSQVVNDEFTVLYNKSQIYFGQNVNIKSAVLDATNGPIFIDDNATIDIGVLIQGPAYIGKNSTLNLGAKIRPNTNIGPYCKVSGEVSSSIILGYSNKGHDGFMGNSYVAEWCNWGAGTINSNLKNDYNTVKIFDYSTNNLEDTGELFVGLFMADHSKAAIATKFNTGTVVGFNCNIFCDGFPPKHVPSFTWGGAQPFIPYEFNKAWVVAQNTASRRGISLNNIDKSIFEYIFEHYSSI